MKEVDLFIHDFKNNEVMRRLMLQLGLIIVVLIIVDRFVGNTLDSLIPRHKCGYYKKINTYLNSVNNYDIVIFGNSRGMHQYVPKVFEHSLNTKTINAGIDGAGLPYYKALIDFYLKRHKPKLIIIDINNRELEESIVGDKYNAIRFLSPFFTNEPELKQSLNLSFKDNIIQSSGLVRYNTRFYGIIKNCISCKDDISEGYKPFFGTAKRDLRNYRDPVGPIDNERIDDLESIIASCKEKGVKLLFIFSPKRNIDDRKFYSRKLLTKILEKHKLQYWDFTISDKFKAKQIFYDSAHLNHQGAVRFSDFISRKIIESQIL
ncbi:hypothetical protein [Solitalea lacus]|uniref:hypothetical protein n=1 Tax=Solitalea lacus TaxID=2911172 RepID=UPI001EDBDA8D|nr:hypothetical protein [Solitalea lacus]UKJ07215.1 hypothetical protein L2B55_17015 [Solitalea lacus]